MVFGFWDIETLILFMPAALQTISPKFSYSFLIIHFERHFVWSRNSEFGSHFDFPFDSFFWKNEEFFWIIRANLNGICCFNRTKGVEVDANCICELKWNRELNKLMHVHGIGQKADVRLHALQHWQLIKEDSWPCQSE